MKIQSKTLFKIGTLRQNAEEEASCYFCVLLSLGEIYRHLGRVVDFICLIWPVCI